MLTMVSKFKKRIVNLSAVILVLFVVVSLMPSNVSLVQAAQSVITAEDVSVTQGEKFDLLSGVKVVDSTGVETTSKVIVSGKVDTNTPATYSVKYSITDTTGDKVEKIRKVTVVEKQKIAKVKISIVDNPGYQPKTLLVEESTLSIVNSKDGKEVARVTFSSESASTVDLPYGVYTIKPIQLFKDVSVLTGTELIVDKADINHNFVVQHKFSRFTLESYINLGPTYRLNGVVYEIRDSNGKLVETVTTAVDGVKLLNLPNGKYTITVVKIPVGYKLSKKSPKTITVTGVGKRGYESETCTFEFEKDTTPVTSQSTSGKLPKTGSHQGNDAIVLGGVIGLLSMFAILKKLIK